MKFSFFILFVSAAISFTKGADSPINYDITTLLNNSIIRAFRNPDRNILEQTIVNMTENYYGVNFNLGIHHDTVPFHDKYYFSGVKVNLLIEFVRVDHVFSKSETTIFIPHLLLNIRGYFEETNATLHSEISILIHFENISIVASKPDQLPESKLNIRLEYPEIIYAFPWFYRSLSLTTQLELEAKFKQMLPSMLLENLQHNDKFLKSIGTTFCNHPKQEIISQCPDFEQNPSDQYYYFIPNITSLQRTLSNITIAGLSNLQSYAFAIRSKIFARTLKFENIRGNASLHYGCVNSTIFALRFEAGLISIVLDEKKQYVNVTAYNYSVSQNNSNSPLSAHQQEWIIEGIELAIASSLMPSYKVFVNRNKPSTQGDHPIVKISTTMSQQFDSYTLRKLYQDLNVSKPENITVESNLQLGSSDYNISIICIPKQLQNPYPHWIQCNLYDSLRLFFDVDEYSIGKIIVRNSTYIEDIDFMNTYVFSGVVKRNNSKEKDGFEPGHARGLGIQNVEEDCIVFGYQFTDDQLAIIFQKAKKMLISKFSEILTGLARPFLSSPVLNYCTRPVEMFDDFLPFFAPNELVYRVPDVDDKYIKLFSKSKIHDVVIEEWTESPSVWVSFYGDEVDENTPPNINTKLGKTKIRMSQSDESLLELAFENAEVNNINGDFEVKLQFDKYNNSNGSSSVVEMDFLLEELKDIIAESIENITRKIY